MRAIVRTRFFLMLFGIAAGLVVTELSLHLAAAVVARVATRAGGTWFTTNRRVLFIGDSNTYGLYVERGAAYPQQTEILWNARPGVRGIEALNLGYPGNNTSQARNALPRMLDTLHPDVVSLMLGGNDWWTVPEAVAGEPEPRFASIAWRYSRLYRLLYIGAQRWQASRLDVPALAGGVDGQKPSMQGQRWTARYGSRTFEFEWRRRDNGDSDFTSGIYENLVVLVGQIRRAGAIPILLTYPSHETPYGMANAAIRRTAEETQARLVDLGEMFGPLCPTGNACSQLFPDGHPSASGHALAARILTNELADTL